MNKVILKVYQPEDVKTVYAMFVDERNFGIKSNSLSEDLFMDSLKINALWYEGDVLVGADVEYTRKDKDIYYFKITSKIEKGLKREHYRIDYKGNYYIKLIDMDSVSEFKRLIDRKSIQAKTTMSNKIKNIIQKETTNMQYVLRFLLEIDLKLDAILEMVGDKEVDLDFMLVDAIDISGGGLSFFSPEQINKDLYLYIEGDIREAMNRVKFYALGKIVTEFKTPKGYIYGVEFKYIDYELREDIIKFVFEKDRELIKKALQS
ncbi:PilZ domain-containing protein [Deferribacter autotrophicus]|uniref:PilZ domain-containing protein n=1 Tax=Deferribacter autotrophicus TaxID=500465 RepID=A0A5A8F1F6_9BACT|nr:PilZ domain-containing protein [Deferribacter autotrophicus]KAA0257099.1 PilZ domain-containing protein [Deferribacter autotrophicus]